MSNFYGLSKNSNTYLRMASATSLQPLVYNSTTNSYTVASTAISNLSTSLNYANFAFAQCNTTFCNLDSSFQGATTIQNIDNNNWFMHSNLSITTSNLSARDMSYAWQFIRSLDTNNTFYLLNAFGLPATNIGAGGWYLGTSNSDSIVVTSNVNTNANSTMITKWIVYPLNTNILNVKPMAHLYSILSVNAMDLLNTVSNGQRVTRWGKLVQSNASSAPTFYSSGGFLNRPYVHVDFNTMYLNSNVAANFLNNGTNFFGVTSTPGLTYFILCNLYTPTIYQRLISSTPPGGSTNDGFIWQRNTASASPTSSTYISLTLNGSKVFEHYPQVLDFKPVWRVYAVRYRRSDGLLRINSTGNYTQNYNSTSVFNSYPNINSNMNMVNYIFTSNTTMIWNTRMYIDSMYLLDSFIDNTSTLNIMNSMITGGSIPSQPTVTNMAYEYTMNNSSNDSAIIGQPYNQYLMPIKGSILFAPSFESGKSCLDLTANGTNGTQYANVSHYIDCTGNVIYDATYSIWIKQSAAMTNGVGAIITLRHTNVYASCYVTPSNTLELSISAGLSPSNLTYSTNLVGNWNHVAFTLASTLGYASLYLNGQKVVNRATTYNYASATSFWIDGFNFGQLYNSTNSNIGGFPGYMAYFRYHPFVLTDDQVMQLYLLNKANIPNIVFNASFATNVVPSIDSIGSNALSNRGAFMSLTYEKDYVLQTGSQGNLVATTFDIPQSYTKSAWIMSFDSVISTTQHVLSSASASNSMHMLWFDGTPYLSAGHSKDSNTVTAYVTDTSPISSKVWTHYAVTYDDPTTVMKLYRNGSNVASVTSSNLSWSGGSNQLSLGAYNGQNMFSGYMDEVQVYSRALSDWEVKYLYSTQYNESRIPISAYHTKSPPITLGV